MTELKPNKLKQTLMIGLGLIASLILISGIAYQSFQSAQQAGYMDHEMAESSSEIYLLQRRKAQILQNSYEVSMSLGAEYKTKDAPDVALSKYFDAKSIYPTAIEPRIELSRLYFQRAMQYSTHCWEAKKEILYAFKYIRRTEYPDYYSELQLMKRKLDIQCGNNDNYAFLEDLKNLEFQ